MNPFKFGQLMKHLVRAKQKKPDLPEVFRASDAPIPPKKESIETMEAINRFVRDNPRQDMAGGGMLVQPGFGGTRQGYAKEKDVGKKLVTLKELSKLDFPISEVTLKQVFTAKDTNKAYKKIFKDNGIKVVKKGLRNALLFEIPTKNQIDGVWKDTIELVQSGKATVPEKMKTPFKNEVLKIFDEFSKTDTPFSTSDIYYKLVENVQDNPRIYIPKKLKGGTLTPNDCKYLT